MHEGCPVAYMSQTLLDREQRKSVYERELVAIVLAIIAIQIWRHCLLGRKFVVHTNQKSLKFLVEQQMMGQEQQKWMAKLLGYDFEIKYKAGKENRAADALSRRHYFGAISSVTIQDWEGLEEEVQQDNKLRSIMQALLHGGEVLGGFQLKGGRLYYKDR